MSADNAGRPRVCGPISSSSSENDTLTQLTEFARLAREGWVLDTNALYATLAFANGDVLTDARLYAADVINHLPGDRLRLAASTVMSQPTRESIRQLGQQCQMWLLTVESRKSSKGDESAVVDTLQRADLYNAALGKSHACERAATHAYSRARVQMNSILHARYTAIALSLLDRAYRLADTALTERRIIEMTSGLWFKEALRRLEIASDSLIEHRRAQQKRAAEADKIEDMLSDLPNAPTDNIDLQVDLDALLTVADPTPPIPASVPSTLVVLRTLSHLPETKSSSQPNPRLEFASICGVEMPLAETPDLQAISRELTAEMPWATDIISTLLMDSVGSPASRIRNTLLVGRPGCGKTRLARRLGEVLRLQPTVVPAAGAADASFGGTNRQWSTGRASTPLQAIKRTGIANPMLIIDELEKAGTSDHNGRLTDVLIPFLEIESSRRYHDPYLECSVDLSAVSYIATANTSFRLSGPLLDRLRVLEIPQPRKQDLLIVVRTILVEIRQQRNEDEVWCPELNCGELNLLARQWRGGSLRPLRRMIETILAGRMAFAPRH
ncbi:AAA family ATPase [Microvirga sp. G4-2]|uniref:AAA family ATPase n=1 Tax=Microvirga sp. G4-2 TaxID=3434467 RepID=UPI0040441619